MNNSIYLLAHLPIRTSTYLHISLLVHIPTLFAPSEIIKPNLDEYIDILDNVVHKITDCIFAAYVPRNGNNYVQISESSNIETQQKLW